MSRSAYDHLVTRGRVNVLRPGKGLGSYALIEYHSLPERFRLRFEAKYGNPEKIMKQEDMPLAVDSEAQKYYHEYLLPNGEHLPEDKQTEYTLNARVLNALREMRGTQKAMRRACNNNTPVIWSNIFAAAEELRKAYGHTKEKHSPSAWRMSHAIPSWSWHGCEGKPAMVEVYARAAKVALKINGKTVGEAAPKNDCVVRFSCTYEDGTVEAVSYDAAGNEIGRTALHTANTETRLCLVPEEETVRPGGLAFVQLRYTDENGTG